jgi:ATP-dependent Clp protease adapter protein ClpS
MSLFSADRPDVPRQPGDIPGPNHAARAPRPRQLARYQVVLVAKPELDLMHIIRSIMQLTRFPREEATHKMWEAHHAGRSVILTTYLERAELYAVQFQEHGLMVIVEPVG